MKDSYTLDRDMAGLDEATRSTSGAYDRIFDRCGLEFYKVESDTGFMGGTMAHEYMAPSSAGEDERRALRKRLRLRRQRRDGAQRHLQRPPARGAAAEVETPGVTTIEGLAAVPRHRPAGDGKAMPVVGRRRHARARAGARRPPPARAEAAQGARPGTARRCPRRSRRPSAPSPARSARSASAARMRHRRRRDAARGPTWVGANRTGWHLTGVELGRDFQASSPTCTRSRTATAARAATAARCGRAGDRDRQHLQARHALLGGARRDLPRRERARSSRS
jgi:prolyl-tRNA synthetase